MTGVSNTTLIDIRLFNTSYNDPSQEYSMFSFDQSENLVINSIAAQKHQGSMIAIHNVGILNISDCGFTELTTLTTSTNQAQAFLNITIEDLLGQEDVRVVLENFNVNVPPLLTLLLISQN